MRAGMVKRTGDEVRAEARHMVSAGNLYAVLHRRSRLPWDLHPLRVPGRARRVDEVRCSRQGGYRGCRPIPIGPGDPLFGPIARQDRDIEPSCCFIPDREEIRGRPESGRPAISEEVTRIHRRVSGS